uniref:Uncharacterized protein LOC114344563 n=1 Tax=Diabrotica virgifera virgifera TaxID=50390 RepID=A0A6P7H5D7_DIAVI
MGSASSGETNPMDNNISQTLNTKQMSSSIKLLPSDHEKSQPLGLLKETGLTSEENSSEPRKPSKKKKPKRKEKTLRQQYDELKSQGGNYFNFNNHKISHNKL